MATGVASRAAEGKPEDDRYQLLEVIGTGGMGEVWRAKDLRLDRIVAVKKIHPHLMNEEKAKALLVREARLGASLIGVPNVTATLDLLLLDSGSQIDGIVMEYVDGPTVSHWIKSTSSLRIALRNRLDVFIAYQLVVGLEMSHAKGVLHRDLKPNNAYISSSGMVKIGDFGISRFVDATSMEHSTARTCAYAAPEQWNDADYNAASDVYQLGGLLYHLFSRRKPFEYSSLPAMMNAHLNKTPEPIANYNPSLPVGLSDVVAECLGKEGMARPNLLEVRAVLWGLVSGEYSFWSEFSDDDIADMAGVFESAAVCHGDETARLAAMLRFVLSGNITQLST